MQMCQKPYASHVYILFHIQRTPAQWLVASVIVVVAHFDGISGFVVLGIRKAIDRVWVLRCVQAQNGRKGV